MYKNSELILGHKPTNAIQSLKLVEAVSPHFTDVTMKGGGGAISLPGEWYELRFRWTELEMAGLHEGEDDRECLQNTPSGYSLIIALMIVSKTDPELGVINVNMRFDAYRA